MQSKHNVELVQVCLTDKMRLLVVPPNSMETLCFRVKTCSDNSISSCDSETEVLCQGVQNVLSSGDLGFSALLAKEYIVEGLNCPITIASGSSVSEAFSLCKGETATSSSNTGKEDNRARADLFMPATPVDYLSVIFSSKWAFGTPWRSVVMSEEWCPKTQGPRCPSLTTALGSLDDPVSKKGVHKLFVSLIFAQKRLIDGGDSVATQASLNIPDSNTRLQSPTQGSVPSFNGRSELSKNNLLLTSATCNQYASIPTWLQQASAMSSKYGFASVSQKVLKWNRWGIPCGLGLLGGGESAANGWGATTQSTAWANGSNNQPNPQGHWGAAASSSANRPGQPQSAESQSSASNLKSNQSGVNSAPVSAPNNQPTTSNNTSNNGQANQQPQQQTSQPQNASSNQQPPAAQPSSSGSWAQAAGKNISASSNSDVQKLQTIKEALLSCEGWGGENVNQETSWDLPPSPEPSKDAATPHWKLVPNNGCELWENNLRNGGVAPPKVSQAPWGKDPTFNYGGTWGEDDESADTSNVWISNPGASSAAGPPASFPPNQQNMWMGGPQKKAPDWGQGSSWGDHGPNRPVVDQNPPDWGAHKNPLHVGPHSAGPHSNHPGPSRQPPHQVTHGPPAHIPSHPGMHPASHPPPHNGPHVPHPGGHTVNHQMHSGGHSAPHQGSHVAPSASSLVSGRWNGSHNPKDPKVGGWEEPSPPASRRDDGTGIWGKPNPPGNSGHWKEGGPNHMMQRPGSSAMQGGRLSGPSISTAPMKPDQKMWSHQSHNGTWNDNSHEMSSPVWGDESKPSWSEPQVNSPSWMKPKWAESEIDASPWNTANKMSKLYSKDLINSRQLRYLQGFLKKEDIEAVLRNNNINLEESLMDLGPRGAPGSDCWTGGPLDDHMPFSDLTIPNFPQRFPHQQLPFNSQQSAADNSQVRALMTHIQLAAQAGYLNPSILSQPLSQGTLASLNQLLSLISMLHKLVQQQGALTPQMHLNKTAQSQMLQLNLHIHKIKQQIQSVQGQIVTQQAAYVKQHQHHSQPGYPGQSHLPPNISGPGIPNDYQSGLPDPFYNKFSDMKVTDTPSLNSIDHQGSRLRQWKQPMEHSMGNSGMSNEFVRTPGKPLPHQSQTSPNLTPLLQGSNSAWSANPRPSQSGWPESSGGPDGNSSANTDKTGHGSAEAAWPAQTGAGSYGLDIKPFEPGKQWMMKNIEDDPTVTPGSVTRSPLSLGIQDSDLLNSITKTTTTSTNSDMGGGASLSSLPLQSNTWTFNPSTGPQSSNSPLSGDSKLVGSANRGKNSWGDGPQSAGTLGSDLWGAGNKNRGPPPGIGANKPSGSNWGAIGRSTSWSGDQQRNQSNSALHSANNPAWPSSQPTSTWLTLKNLTPQIDGSTLKTLCLQHGPLINFHLSLNHGIALVHYGSREEAIKAQGNLNNCILGNTTILAEFANESEVNQWVGGSSAGSWAGSGRGSTPTSGTSKDSWSGTTSTSGSTSLWSNGPNSGTSSLWSGSTFGDGDQHRTTPSSLKSFLPDGLLNPETM